MWTGQPEVFLEQHEHYRKGSFRNRYHIAAANGVQRLTVPLRKGKNQQQPIREVRIAYDEPWPSQHWSAIRSAYGNSPFFEHYEGRFEPFFRQKKYEWLWDWNFDLLQTVCACLKIETRFLLTETYLASPVDQLDCRNWVVPKPEGVSRPYKLPRYPQVFEDKHGFLENLSVLDLLFCGGPQGRSLLAQTDFHQ